MDLLRRHEGHHEVSKDKYWALGYYFETLTEEQLHERRELLDRYGFAAQWSVLVIFVLFQVSFALAWLLKSGLKHDLAPKSPSFNKRFDGKLGWLRTIQGGCNKTMWWLRKDVIRSWNWGTRGEWIGASVWTVWLLYLCIDRTGKDYLHLTKRFGQIGASQLPIHYLLAMRAPYSPVQYLTRLSHEQLKSAHQFLGRITFLLFLLHGVFYFIFFIKSGFLAKRIKDWDVIWGLTSFALFTLISTTALAFIRRRNYRVFYISHIAIANFIIVPLYLHVSHIRIYVWQIIAVEVLHLVFRAVRLNTYQGTIRILPGTNLVQIRIPLPPKSSALHWKPGMHVYLSRPWSGAKGPGLWNQWVSTNKTNPFTIASLPAKDNEVLLVARTLKGNTKYLGDLARSLAQGGSNVPMLPTAGGDIPILPIVLEGPYGASTRLPDFAEYDRVLLVAGGVGATFIIPIFRSILLAGEGTLTGMQVRCVWAVQKLADTQWAFSEGGPTENADDKEDENENGDENGDENGNGGGLLQAPPKVEVYVTRPSGPNLHTPSTSRSPFVVDPDASAHEDEDEGEEFEMAENEQLLSMEGQMQKPRKGMVVRSGRPNLDDVVEEACSKGMRTAVVCCGPERLTGELKEKVERWVSSGHEVFWWEERFGW